MSDVNWKPKGAKVLRRDAPAEEPKKVKKVQPKDDAPAKKLKPGVGKVKRGVVEMPSSAKGDPDARARKRKQLKDKVAKTSESSKAAVEKVKVEKKTKGVKEPLVVLWENEEGTARVVATVNPAHDKYPEMLNVRRQYRRKDETDWSFTRDGFSLPNPNRKMTQRIADGLSELAGMIK